MTTRRTFAYILIAFGLIAIIGISVWLWLTFRGIRTVVTQQAAEQPPAYTNDIGTPVPKDTGINIPVPIPAYNAAKLSMDEEETQAYLRRHSIDVASRGGTYANGDSFAGIEQIYTDVTPEVKTFLVTQKEALLKEHPLRGASWGQTTRALAAKIVSPLPIGTQTTAEVQVQAQVSSGDQSAAPVLTYKQIVLSYTKINGTWLVNRMTITDFQP